MTLFLCFIPYSDYMVVAFFLYLYFRRLCPFPAFSSRNNVGDSSREGRETALMRCLHHLRAASGERSNLHVGLAATTPLSEEETYRKVCRMGRDAPFLSEDEQRSSPPGSHPWPSLHVGLAATTPLSEEETYRKVCRMGRDAPFLSEDEQRSSPPGSHPWPSFLTRAYGTLPTSLFFSSPNASMLAHVALPSCQPEGGYWASGERSSFHGTGAVWKEQRV